MDPSSQHSVGLICMHGVLYDYSIYRFIYLIVFVVFPIWYT